MKGLGLAIILLLSLVVTACGTNSALNTGPEDLSERAALLAVGATMIDFTAADQWGNTHALSDYWDKPVLVHFCAAWCAPCFAFTQSLPEIEAILDAELGADQYVVLEVLVEGRVVGEGSGQLEARFWAEHAVGDVNRAVLHTNDERPSLELQQAFSQVASIHAYPTFGVLAPGGQVIAGRNGFTLDPEVFAEWLIELWRPYLLTTEARLQALISAVAEQGIQPAGIERSLTAKLERAASHIASGREMAAVNLLMAFTRQVDALPSRHLPAKVKDRLRIDANAVIAELES